MAYIYYRVYQTLKKIKTNDTPAFNSLLIIMIWQNMNIATIWGVFNYFLKFQLLRQQVINYALIVLFVVAFINFIVIFKKRKEIIKRYENESEIERKRGTILVLAYFIGSLIIFFATGEFFR